MFEKLTVQVNSAIKFLADPVVYWELCFVNLVVGNKFSVLYSYNNHSS